MPPENSPPSYSGMAALRLFAFGADAPDAPPADFAPYPAVDDHDDDKTEPLGSKDKQWIVAPDGLRLLFKEGRNDMENWAEIVASEICGRMGIPFAPYALAERDGRRGTVCPDFRVLPDSGGGETRAEFFHARHELKKELSGYDASARVPKGYTAAACAEFLRGRGHVETLVGGTKNTPQLSPLGHFVGYLLLDALISNGDRHHENWGFLREDNGGGRLLSFVPCFDCGSAFSKEPPEKLQARMETRDRAFHIESYCRKARSAFSGGEVKKATTFAAFADAARAHPEARELWLSRLEALDIRRELGGIFDSAVRFDILHPVAAEFSLRTMEINRAHLLSETDR